MFSVVIPLFNKLPYVARAIESILAQRFQPAEIIVIDDGSTDGGGDLIARQFPAVNLIRQDNAGAGAARNVGLSSAKAEWIAFLDADDFWTPNHLHELARIIEAYPDVSLVSTQFHEIIHGRTYRSLNPQPSRVRKINFFTESARSFGIVHSSSAALRKLVLKDVGGFGFSKTGEDTEFWARVALTKGVAISDAKTAFYVRGVGGIIETLETQKSQNKIKPIPANSAIESHPACKTVLAAMDSSDLMVPKKSLSLYLNAWRVTLIRQALVRGDTEYARELSKQIQGPKRLSWYGIMVLTFIPTVLMQQSLQIRRKLKKFDHQI